MKLKLISCFVLVSMLVSTVCSAKVLDTFKIEDVDSETIELTLFGTPDNVVKDDNITIQLLKYGKTSEDINYTSGIMDNFLLFTQVLADENGGYSVTANMQGQDAGFYFVRVNGEDAGKIYYSSKTDRESIVEEIKENCPETAQVSDAVTYLTTKFDLDNPDSIWVNSFGITNDVVFSVSKEGLFKAFHKVVPELTIDNFNQKVVEAACVAGLNENLINAIDYKDVLAFGEDFVKLYNENITDDAAFMTDNYVGKGYLTLKEVQDVFNDVMLTIYCNAFDSHDDVRVYIETFGEDFGVDMEAYAEICEDTSLKSDLWVYLAGISSYSGTADFAKKANDKMEDLLDEPSSGGSGGGPSGGPSGAPSGPGFTPPITVTENIPSDIKEEEPKGEFSDMEGFDWAEESVKALAEKGIVSGTGNGKYEPSRNVTREEMLVMILRAFEVEIGKEVSDFTDAEVNGWYNAYLAAAKKAGYISGKPDGSFGVGEAVTREDAAVMAYNIAKAMGREFNAEKAEVFADDFDVADYASEAVYALKNAEVINGKGEGLFAPKANCTRAEAAKIIYTLITDNSQLEIIVPEDDILIGD